MTLQPGQSTPLILQFMMHGEMGGQHNFRVHVFSSDPSEPEMELTVLSNWVD
jgi:hypothetical protein